MSYYNNFNNNPNGFYQPSAQFNVPHGAMSFDQSQTTTTSFVTNEPLPSGLLNALSTKGYPHEPPLLEELGINFRHIITKTKLVLTPSRSSVLPMEIIGDCDLAGPLIFCLLFGTFLLMAGKVHFGYIYGVALFGTVSLHSLLKLMGGENSTANGDSSIQQPQHQQQQQNQQQQSLQFFRTASILGYCFLPLCFLSLFGVFHSLDNTIGYFLSLLFVCWCTWSSSGFFTCVLQLNNARILIAYPLMIFYSVFALMAIFV